MLEQMGYQAENATWRNFFLQGTRELREGIAAPGPKKTSPTIIAAMTMDMIFDAFAAKVIGPRVGDAKIVMNWNITDPKDPYLVWVQDGVLNYTKGKTEERADVSLTLSRDALNALMSGELSLKTAIEDKLITVTGKLTALLHFFLLLDDSDPSFPIVTPRSDSEAAWSGADKLIGKLEDLKDSLEKLMEHPAVAKAGQFIGELPRGC